MRSIEEVLAIKKRQLAEVRSQIDALEAAMRIVETEPEARLPIAVGPGVPADHPPEQKRWP